MTLDDAHLLKGGELLVDEERENICVVLGPPVESSEPNPFTRSQWRLPVFNLETGSKESWPSGRLFSLTLWP